MDLEDWRHSTPLVAGAPALQWVEQCPMGSLCFLPGQLQLLNLINFAPVFSNVTYILSSSAGKCLVVPRCRKQWCSNLSVAGPLFTPEDQAGSQDLLISMVE